MRSHVEASSTPAIAARPGERTLDLACGPGFYLAELITVTDRALKELWTKT
jgi:hypothetical protein